jgi:hypothetical protein
MCSIFLMSAEENPFDSILGMKWGINAREIAEKLFKKYEIEEIGSGGVLGALFGLSIRDMIDVYRLNMKDGFYFHNLKLGSLYVGLVLIGSEPTQKDLKWKESNFDKFKFSNVIFVINSNEFEGMLDILKIKYGTPTDSKEYIEQIPVYQEKEIRSKNSSFRKIIMTSMTQQEVMWKHNDRIIILQKYSEDDAQIGFVFFDKIDNNSNIVITTEETNKEGAEVL